MMLKKKNKHIHRNRNEQTNINFEDAAVFLINYTPYGGIFQEGNVHFLKNLSRIDFLYDYNNNKLYFNEVNTMPGFTDISMYPLLIKEKGISIKELITNLIEY